jgi:hypothetical protein
VQAVEVGRVKLLEEQAVKEEAVVAVAHLLEQSLMPML